MRALSEDSPPLNTVDEYILALLGANNRAPLPGKLYLQKEMYLIQRAFEDLQSELDYEPYFLGPHSATVEDEADQLSRSSIIESTDAAIRLTPRGQQLAERAKKELGPERIHKIEEFKRLLNDLSNDELLAFIYFGFPGSEVEKESAEYRKLLGRRAGLAKSLLKKGKITVERASEIAGVPLEEFLSEL
jgi:uncharacterized protein YwgA